MTIDLDAKHCRNRARGCRIPFEAFCECPCGQCATVHAREILKAVEGQRSFNLHESAKVEPQLRTAEDERAAIVKWLRAKEADMVLAFPGAKHLLPQIVEAIESGVHLTKKGDPNAK